MSDDLSKLTPTDPSAVDPSWSDKRQDILDDVLADTSPRRRHIGRWIAGVAAAALVAVAVGGVVQQFRPAPYASPAPPAPSTSGPELLAATSLLIGKGDDVGICVGVVMESLPPQCSAIPVTGMTWADVPWAETSDGDLVDEAISGTSWGEATIVGTFDGTSFAATEVLRSDDPAAPRPPRMQESEDFPTLCDAPIKGTGTGSTGALMAVAETLPGYQALWVSPNQSTFNVAVTEDLTGARTAISEVFGGEFCVGTLDGPTDMALHTAQQALEPLATQSRMQDPMPEIPDAQLIWGASYNVSARGHRLEVSTLLETREVLEQVQSAVGPEVWEYTDVYPFFYPVDASASPEPVEHSPGPYGSLPTTAFTDEQRGWAEDSVASDLRSSDASDRSDVAARMAKLTYGEYMAVWNIDIPEPPGPTRDDAEILVVALSAPVDGGSLHGGPPALVTPAPTAIQTPPAPVGTVTVLDPITGETLSHAFIVGGTPPAKRLSQMAWFGEDVPLPAGYR